jgi:CBS domain containing-hemolysin-like protein
MSEISLAGARKIKLQILIDEGSEAAKKVLSLQENPGHFFTAVQIGLNTVALLAGGIGNNILNPYLIPFLEKWLGMTELGATGIANVISFMFVTALFIEFADLIPKRIAMVYPEQVAMATVRLMSVFVVLFMPIIFLFNGLANIIFKIFKTPHAREEIITHEDIFAVMDAGAEAGVVDKKEHHLIENVFELESRWVSSAMTQRDDIIYFSLEEDEETIKNKIANYPHSKFLVCENDLDSIVGYLASKEILPHILRGEEDAFLRNIGKECNKNLLIIPNTLTLSEVLDRFNEVGEDFAVIINEYGHVVGLITLNDVMTTVMGNVAPLQDELIIKRGDDSWLIDGTTPIEDVQKAIGVDEFPEQDSYETLGGFLMYMLKSIPKKAASVDYDGFTFEVMDVDNYKIDQVLVTKHPDPISEKSS